ncbi:rhodanese-like domain-containing protein [uncultured Ilyobacter sp.]|uniref:rhodanese-like domain-containing protein n=1 Tax=uncultured Ilyobacter sp. TaxID=544433 RepID=UPI0029C018E1|nr:rhodanese-like domain-containing protein [uncultured Ilyobacter sp.]
MKKILLIFSVILFAMGCSNKSENPGEISKEISKKIEVLSTRKVKKSLKNEETVLIDTRSYDEYNGWDIKETGIQGHISGAYNLPASSLEHEGIEASLERKGIKKDNKIILYGDDTSMAEMLSDKGYDVYLYEAGIKEWNKKKYPIEKLPRYESLVPVSWVKKLLEEKDVPEYNGKPVKVINAGWGKKGKFHKDGHIPGSYYVHTGWFEVGPLWNRVSDETIKTELEKLGITKETLVIVYGEDPMPAARFAIICKYAGVEDVRIINGGWKAWQEAGYPTEEGIEYPLPVEEFGMKVPGNPDIIIDLPEAENYLKSDKSDLVSIRSWKEYIGKISGYDYIKPRGRIRGDKWGMGGSDPWHLEEYRADYGTYMRPYNEILKMWEDLKIDTDKNIAFYCGTGWRASEVLFYAYVMGLDKVSLYDGGWKEWSENPETEDKILKGEPENLNEEKY